MSVDYVKKMFVGEILIVDDEVFEEGTDAYAIASYLKENSFSVIKKDTFPKEQELAGHKLSMVICDWMFIKNDDDSNARVVIEFLNKVQGREFVPVFICTGHLKQSVKEYLSDPEYNCVRYKDNGASSIFVVEKGEIKKEAIFEFLENWLKKNPSVKLLKEWELSLNDAKNKMFNDLYLTSEYWPWALVKSYKKDGEKNIGESIGEFVTKNLLSRISSYQIEEMVPDCNADINIGKVLEGERCFYYEDTWIEQNTSFKTGDILERGEDLFVVIKRQCDLNRENNRDLYLLKMSEMEQISASPISVDPDNKKIQVLKNTYSLESDKSGKINKSIKSAFGQTRVLHKGKILETSNQVIIPCVCQKSVVSINLKELSIIEIESENLKQYKRIARLLEPYISIVIDKFSSYVASKGSMRIPEELFSGKFFLDNCDEDAD